MSHATNSDIWVSELNARPEIRAAFPRSTVRFYDTTLRDGEQTVGVVLSPEQKLEIARKLDALGINRIEAGFPRVSADDAEAIQLMLKAGLRAELWGFSRAVRADVEELVRLGLRASVIEAPTSDIKLRAYGISRDEVLIRVSDAVSFAKQNGIRVAFFVCQVCAWVGSGVPVHFHGHDDFGMATACAIAAIRGGASWIQGTINGMGERAGNADVGEIALALRCLYDVPVALDLAKIREVSEFVQRA